MKKLALLVLVLLIITAIAVAGFFACKYFFQKPAPSQNITETAGWKTYTDSHYNFEVSYPYTSTVSTDNQDLRFFLMPIKNPISIFAKSNSTTPSVNVFIGPTKDNIDNCIKFNFNSEIENMTKMQEIGGVTFYTESQGDAAMGGQRGLITQYSTIKNNICYTIQTQISWRDIAFVHSATDGKQPTKAEIDAQNESIQEGKDYVWNIVKTFKFVK